jgi:hypothetical protein
MSTAFDYSSATETAEKSDSTPDEFEFLEHRGNLYAISIEGLPDSNYDQVIQNDLNNGQDSSLLDHELEREDIEVEASVYSSTYDEFKEVNGDVVDEILEERLGI